MIEKRGKIGTENYSFDKLILSEDKKTITFSHRDYGGDCEHTIKVNTLLKVLAPVLEATCIEDKTNETND